MVVPGKIRQGERITLARVKSWWAKDRKYYRYSCNADQVEHVFVNLENKAIEMFRRGDLDMMNIRKPEIWEGKLELPEVHRGYIDKYSLEAGYACPPYGLYLNCSDGMLRNTDIRKGLAHAVNMGMVIDSLFRGNMRRLGSYMEGYGDLTLPLKAPEYSKKKAMEYFARAGFREMGEDGILKNERGERLCLELTFADSSHVMTNVCSIIRQEALKCGVDLKLDPLTYSVCSRKVFEKRYQAALWAWPLDTPFPRLYETFASELAYDGRGNSVGNTNNIFAVADAELDAALDVEREAPDYPALKEALHRAQKRIHDLCIWIPGWREPYTHIACWRWIRWPESPTRFCSPRLYNPLESHLYWVDDKMKKETQDARRRGIPFEERHEVIRLKDRDDPLRPSSGE
jgi:extracellular solute-binding protein family 5